MAKGKGKVIDKDLGWQRVIQETAKLAQKPYVQVGFQGQSALEVKTSEAGKKPKARVVDVATFHEFGAPNANIPERSFMRSTYDNNEDRYLQILAKFKEQIFDLKTKMTAKKALTILGKKMVLDIQKTIRDGLSPPWAESTKKAKIKKIGGPITKETPLIETGQLLASINYKVEDKS